MAIDWHICETKKIGSEEKEMISWVKVVHKRQNRWFREVCEFENNLGTGLFHIDPNNIRLQFELTDTHEKPFLRNSFEPIHLSSPPWTLTKLPTINNSTYIHQEWTNYISCSTNGSNYKTVYAYSISGSIVLHRIRNNASVYLSLTWQVFAPHGLTRHLPPLTTHLYLHASPQLNVKSPLSGSADT